MFAVCGVVYASVLTIGFNDLFYSRMQFEMQEGQPVLLREYGPMHSVFYLFVALFLIVGISAIVYSWFRKKDIPRRILLLLVIPEIICVMAYFVVLKVFSSSLDLVPLGYVLAEIVYLLIAHRVNLYDISDTVIDSMVHERSIGYISFDFRLRYLGSNRFAKQLVPGLADLPLDRALDSQPDLQVIKGYLDAFRQQQEEQKKQEKQERTGKAGEPGKTGEARKSGESEERRLRVYRSRRKRKSGRGPVL